MAGEQLRKHFPHQQDDINELPMKYLLTVVNNKYI